MKMKKTLAILLAVLLACGAFPAGAAAEEQGLFQYEVKWDDTAEITGISDEDIGILVIPAEVDGHPVTSIGCFAFGNCGNLVSATIPEGVTSIGTTAFGNCFRLESVSIPDSLDSIGKNAFRSERLTEIRISPDHPVFAVENEALIDKRDMTLVRFLAPEITGTYEIAQGIRAIGAGAFELNQLSSLVIPDSVTEIGNEAMAYCDNLAKIVIPDSVTSIGSAVFSRCTRLESITIPDSVTEIGGAVFDDCSGLTSISISPDHPVYEVIGLLLVRKADKAVISASGALRGSYAVPEEIRTIGACAFQGCRDLEELLIPYTVTGIGEYAFNVNTVIRACAGSAAQEYCAADSRYRFTEITREEFADEVLKLEQEKASGETAEPLYSGEKEADVRVFGKYEYRVLEDGTAEITKADGFLENGYIPSDLDGHPVTAIASQAFMDCYDLQTAVIPEGVVSVGRSAFWGCYALESVTFPDSLVSAEGQMFIYCPKLKTVEVSLDHPVFAVENRALVNKQDQALIVVLDHEDTGTYTVAQGIRQIGDAAFYNASFSSILLPDSVTAIGDHAFVSCENLTEMNLPEGVTWIGAQAFFSCEKLEAVTIPDSVTRIEWGIFGNDPALTTVRISPDHPAYEMNGPLLVDKRDRKIVMALNSTSGVFEIPEGIKAIGSLAFQGCSALTELIVPEGVTDIGTSAFVDCNELRVVTLPASMNDIGPEAFYSSEGLLIRAPAGSRAEQYARENGYRFEALPADADGAAGEPAGGESLGSGTEPQGGPVYRDEAVTVTVDSITTDGKTVRAGFLVECAENRACMITTNIPEDWMTSIDAIEALRAVKRAGAGKVVRYCESGQSILCEFEWDLDKIYDTPFTFITAPFETGIQGQTVSLSLSASGFPETAGFTLVECTGDYDTLLNDAIAGAGGEGLQEAVTGIICLQFSAE